MLVLGCVYVEGGWGKGERERVVSQRVASNSPWVNSNSTSRINP